MVCHIDKNKYATQEVLNCVLSSLSKQTEEDETEYLKENDKTRESQSKSLDTKTKEEETLKESSEESIKTEIESSQE